MGDGFTFYVQPFPTIERWEGCGGNEGSEASEDASDILDARCQLFRRRQVDLEKPLPCPRNNAISIHRAYQWTSYDKLVSNPSIRLNFFTFSWVGSCSTEVRWVGNRQLASLHMVALPRRSRRHSFPNEECASCNFGAQTTSFEELTKCRPDHHVETRVCVRDQAMAID